MDLSRNSHFVLRQDSDIADSLIHIRLKPKGKRDCQDIQDVFYCERVAAMDS
jgi:hypothetical protein